MPQLNRRTFLAATSAAVTCACLGAATTAADEASSPATQPEPPASSPTTEPGAATQPGPTPEPDETPPPGLMDVGDLSDFARPGIYDQWARSHKVYLVHQDDRLYALSAICTHRRCTLKPRDQGLACPCHGSRFTPQGNPTKGPAKRPLPRFAIQVDPRRRVLVDSSQVYSPEQWDNPGAYVSLDSAAS